MPFRVTLAYDGTDFEGWQIQARRDARTVQGVVADALARLDGGRRATVHGAGRTDTGVHALGQVASFELQRSLSDDELLRALNGLLPEDVRAVAATSAAPGFHARKSAVSKLYRYELDLGPQQLPTRRRYAGHARTPLDVALMRGAAALYVGHHDFAALASSGSAVRSTVRQVTRAELRQSGATIVFEVEADGFLRRMVRSMVGGLIAVGAGRAGPGDLESALRGRDRRAWPAPAEARGLTLVSVAYAPDAAPSGKVP